MDKTLAEFNQLTPWIRKTVFAIFFLFLYPVLNSWIVGIEIVFVMPLIWGVLFVFLNGLAYRVTSEERRVAIKTRIIKIALWTILAFIYQFILAVAMFILFLALI
jgi:hypothetical protein